MPLTRLQVRNEYGLGGPNLFKSASKDDPDVILTGVAVAGLVGILRQLGDLAEFAAEVFDGLHEQVTFITSRSQKIKNRLDTIEIALPTLEKKILAQKNHLHFAYVAGSYWHAKVQTKLNHFGHDDKPRFIMDSYDRCRPPPSLFLLDKFDPAGAGACLKRYSDPSLFRSMADSSSMVYTEEVQGIRKFHKSFKKKRSYQKAGDFVHPLPLFQSYSINRLRIGALDISRQIVSAETRSSSSGRSKSKFSDHFPHSASKTGLAHVEHIFSSGSLNAQEPGSCLSSRSELVNQATLFGLESGSKYTDHVMCAVSSVDSQDQASALHTIENCVSPGVSYEDGAQNLSYKTREAPRFPLFFAMTRLKLCSAFLLSRTALLMGRIWI